MRLNRAMESALEVDAAVDHQLGNRPERQRRVAGAGVTERLAAVCRDGNRLLIRRDIGCAERVLAAEIAPCFHRRRKRQFTAEAFVRIIDDGHIDFVAGIAISVGTIPGAVIGSLLAKRVPERTLRLIFGGMLFVAAVMLVVNEFALI